VERPEATWDGAAEQPANRSKAEVIRRLGKSLVRRELDAHPLSTCNNNSTAGRSI
jgi:hypothetical protein